MLTTTTRWQDALDIFETDEEAFATYEFEGALPQWFATRLGMPGDKNDHWRATAFFNLCRDFGSLFLSQIPGILFNVLASHAEPRGLYCPHHQRPRRSATSDQDQCIILMLLDDGPQTNPAGFGITPLQVAVSLNDRRATKYLLKAGAYVNASGVHDGQISLWTKRTPKPIQLASGDESAVHSREAEDTVNSWAGAQECAIQSHWPVPQRIWSPRREDKPCGKRPRV